MALGETFPLQPLRLSPQARGAISADQKILYKACGWRRVHRK
eukprot:CAMPEP_0115731190 /NCGR_PEP_ID=MMETSP0272-20121206/84446_1 /TAXON_ID=71861 /ORGANISM="Scrippsiella trochoidea, Strain CCMP3099" /LENGTH=41 /DNA_ID= /DNA_START= /DNA_END= /DNA_ORIENTATION=